MEKYNSGVQNVKESGKVVNIKELLTGSIAVNGITQYIIKPRKGYKGKISFVGLSVVGISGATGNHQFIITMGTDIQHSAERITDVSVTATSSLVLLPQSNSNTLLNTVFDYDNPLVITYFNASNAIQTASRVLRVSYQEV